MSLEIEIIERTPEPVLAIRGTAPPQELGSTFAQRIQRVVDHLGSREIPGPPFMRYLEMTDVFEIEVGVPNPDGIEGAGEVRATELPGGPAATAVHRGSYAELGTSWDALFAWAEERGRITDLRGGWDVYENDPSQVSSEAELRTRLVLPLA